MKEKNYSDQKNMAFVSFLLELPNFIAVTTSAILTGSLILLVDFLDSLSNTLKELFVFIISRKLNKNLKYEYNFGITKIEALSSLLCDGVLIFGLFIAIGVSIYEIINPVPISKLLIYAIILKVINVVADTIVYFKQKKIHQETNTTLTAAELNNGKKNLAFDFSVLFSTLICALLAGYSFSVYISPVITIIIAIVFGYEAVKRVSGLIGELTEKTLDEEKQMVLVSLCAKHYEEYKELKSVNSKVLGNDLYVEFDITFDDGTPYEKIVKLRDELQMELQEKYEDCSVSIIINKKE